jgi:hypothetical protein
MQQPARLANAPGAVTRNPHAAYVLGWGVTRVFALSGRHGRVEMDLWQNSERRHDQKPERVSNEAWLVGENFGESSWRAPVGRQRSRAMHTRPPRWEVW